LGIGQKPGFLGVSQAKRTSSGRLLMGQSDSLCEKTWFLCPIVNGYRVATRQPCTDAGVRSCCLVSDSISQRCTQVKETRGPTFPKAATAAVAWEQDRQCRRWGPEAPKCLSGSLCQLSGRSCAPSELNAIVPKGYPNLLTSPATCGILYLGT